MSMPDNKWIDKVRRELTDYSPEYNAADWAALEKLLPAPKGWFGIPKIISNWIKGTLVVIVPAITILAVYLYSIDKNSSENKIYPDTETVVENKVIEQLQVSVPAKTDSNKAKQNINNISGSKTVSQQSGKKIAHKKATTTEKIKAISENKKPKESIISVSETTGEKSTPTQSNTSDYSANKNVATYETTKNDSIIQAQLIKNSTNKTDGTAVKQSLETTTQNSSANLAVLSTTTTKNNYEINSSTSAKSLDTKNKTERKTIAGTTATKASASKKTGKKRESLYKKNKNRKNNRANKRNKSKIKTKKPPRNRQPLPLFIGPSGSAEFAINPTPYNSRLNFAGGIILEKFLTKNSSLSIAPEFFTYNYTETIPGDTIKTPNPPNPDDSLNVAKPPTITVNPSIEKENTLKLLYLDFPVAFNYYILNKKQYRLALFAGISNKYILSIEKNGEKQHLTNKLYLAQSATFGAIYKRQINKNLFFDIEPYITVPLRKIEPENYSWTSFGVKVNLLFNVTRKNSKK